MIMTIFTIGLLVFLSGFAWWLRVLVTDKTDTRDQRLMLGMVIIHAGNLMVIVSNLLAR